METISKLSNQTYLFSLDLVLFCKELVTIREFKSQGDKLAVSGRDLSESLMDCEDTESAETQKVLLRKAHQSITEIMNDLNLLKCSGALLNEKTDLILSAWKIEKELQVYSVL